MQSDDVTDSGEVTKTMMSGILRKKIQKFKRADYTKAKLKYIGYPRPFKATPQCQRRFEVEVQFNDQNNKLRKRLVRFGRKGKEEFIDHKDNIKRINTLNKLSNLDNFLDPNFYRATLLNSRHPEIKDAYFELVETLGLHNDL